MDNQTYSQSKPKSKSRPAPANFLEALRDLGASASQGVTNQVKDIGSEAWNQISGNFPDYPDFPSSYPTQPLSPRKPFESGFPSESELKYRRQAFFERQKAAQEKVVFRKEDQQTKLQIQSLQEEIKKLANSTQNLAQEVQVAAMQAPVDPGSYHVSFFEKLRQVIRDIKKRIDDSATWLSTMNVKGKKQSYYWSQVGKSGTKYLLSQERYMTNSAG